MVPAGTPEILRTILEHGRLVVDVSGCPPLSAGQATDALGGHPMTLQTLESPVFPPKRDVSISSPKTQEESDFLRAVSARWRGRNPTRVPSLALGGPGPALLLSQSQGILSGLPCLGPLRLPHPPYNRVAMWSCRDWPGPEASNRNPSWSRPGPGCGLKDIRRGSQRQRDPGLRPQPHQTPGPLPTH